MDKKEEALEFINWLLTENGKSCLNELETNIFLGVWEGKTYAHIAATVCMSEQYLKEAGPNFYQRIQQELGIKVNKRNFVFLIKTQYQQEFQAFKSFKEKQNHPTQTSTPTSFTAVSPPPKLNLAETENIITNPFVPLCGIVESGQFFNQHKEIQHIFDLLNSNSSVALIGEEGMGKSSLLWAIYQQADNKLQIPRQAVFLDLNTIHDEDDFYSALCEEIGIAESKGYKLTRALRNYRVLLAIDNVGKMAGETFSRQVRDQLRGLAETGDAPLRLVLAAPENLENLFQDSYKTSPLSGICIEVTIKPWDEMMARALITSRLDSTPIRFTEAEIVQIVQESGGHPKKLMQLCNHTYNRYRDAVQ